MKIHKESYIKNDQSLMKNSEYFDQYLNLIKAEWLHFVVVSHGYDNRQVQGSIRGLGKPLTPGLASISHLMMSLLVKEESGWQSGRELDFYPSNPGLTPARVPATKKKIPKK